jgi:hypothetical protein
MKSVRISVVFQKTKFNIEPSYLRPKKRRSVYSFSIPAFRVILHKVK